MFAVGVVSQFEAAHRLRGGFGPATRTHGHTYRVEVSVSGQRLRSDGALCDISEIQAEVDRLTAALNYRDLDELDELKDRNTTAEVLAEHFVTMLRKGLENQGLDAITVRIWESPRAYAECASSLLK